MSKPNAQRIRRTVELGPLVERMLLKLRSHPGIRDRFSYYGSKRDSFLIRLAIRELLRLIDPNDPDGQVDIHDIAGDNASGRPKRRPRGRWTEVSRDPTR